MDLVHDRESVIDKEDRISNLPDDIIHRILSFLDMRLAIRTCTLSKKWKHIWTSMPYFNLDSTTYYSLPYFAKFMKHALSHRSQRAEVSSVKLTFTGSVNQFVIKSILNYAYSHNVRQLTMRWFDVARKLLRFPQYLFSSQTLKHLTLATNVKRYLSHQLGSFLPNSAWDFPALETLNLSNMQLSDSGGTGDRSLNFFPKCVNLKDITLHRCLMNNLDVFNVCAPQLCNLTITDPVAFPKVFNVVAPKLENLTATVGVCMRTMDSKFLHLSTKGLDSLEKVNLSLLSFSYGKKGYVPQLRELLDLFQNVRNAKFLILDTSIIQALSSCLDQLSYNPCPFNSLKCLKIDKKNCTTEMPIEVIKYLLESSPSATVIMDKPQVSLKRSRQALDMGTRAKKMAKFEAEKQSNTSTSTSTSSPNTSSSTSSSSSSLSTSSSTSTSPSTSGRSL